MLSDNYSIGSHPTQMKTVPFWPNSMYCFLPSDSNYCVSISVVNYIPGILKSFKFLMEVDNEVITQPLMMRTSLLLLLLKVGPESAMRLVSPEVQKG